MRRTKFFGLSIGALVLFVAAILSIQFVVGPQGIIGGFSYKTHSQYKSLEIGATKTNIIQFLGEPIKSAPYFLLPQRKGFEQEYLNAEKSKSSHYLLFRNGTNWYYCIGLDSSGKLAFKAEGHS